MFLLHVCVGIPHYQHPNTNNHTQVDGNEDLHTGLNLYEFADLCLAYGAVNAVNLDGKPTLLQCWFRLCQCVVFLTHCGAGGGSATVYEKGKIINHPSDYCSSGLAYVYPVAEKKKKKGLLAASIY